MRHLSLIIFEDSGELYFGEKIDIPDERILNISEYPYTGVYFGDNVVEMFISNIRRTRDIRHYGRRDNNIHHIYSYISLGSEIPPFASHHLFFLSSGIKTLDLLFDKGGGIKEYYSSRKLHKTLDKIVKNRIIKRISETRSRYGVLLTTPYIVANILQTAYYILLP